MAIQTIPGSAITAGTITATQMSNTIQMGGPKISSIILTDSGYATITDTALGLSGGYIRILGTGFVTGCSVSINTVIATSVTFISSTEVRAQLPSMSAGTYIMYLSNSDGGVAIRVNALTYSSTPSWTSTSPLTGGLVNTAISIQLGATSDSTISYTVQAGSTLPTGLTLSSGGLLSGTVTGIALETTYNFTVVATDLESQISPKAFSITIIVSDPYFKSTVLLLNGDVTPFTADASTNKFEISAVGTPSANVNNPLQPGYYSGYFNGSTDYLSVPNINFSTNAFTIEGWFYPFSLATATNFWGTDNGSGSSPKMLMYINGSAQLTIDFGTAGTTQFPIAASIATYGLNTYQWNHIALVRSDLTATGLKLYINGILAGTGQVGTNLSTITAIFNVGYIGEAYGTKFNGYISNTRVINGVAVYTGNFTPPTLSLTSTQSAGFLAATPTVDVLVVAGGGAGGGGGASTAGGSGGGAGGLLYNSQYSVNQGQTYNVTVGAGGPPGVGTGGSSSGDGSNGSDSTFGNLTSIGGGGGRAAENNYPAGVAGKSGGSGGGASAYYTSVGGGGAGTIGQGSAGGTGASGWGGAGAGGGAGAVGGTGVGGTNGTISPSGGVGLQYSISVTATYYAGGGGSGNYSQTAGSGGLGGGGAGNTGAGNGVSGSLNTGGGGGGAGGQGTSYGGSGGSGIVVLRYLSSYPPASSTTGNPSVVVAGGYRIYTWTTSGTITFGDSTIAAITGTATSLLTCQSNRFIDNSSTPNTITVSGTPNISVAQPFTLPSPYTGYGSGLFNGSSDYFTVTKTGGWLTSGGNFTVEYWAYLTSYPSSSSGNYIACPFGTSGSSNGWEQGFSGTASSYTSYFFAFKGAGGVTATYSFSLNRWYHIAVVKNSSTTTAYINGVSSVTSTNITTWTDNAGMNIGLLGIPSYPYWFPGYISNMRIVNGTAVYTGAFTPPTELLSRIQSSGTNIAALSGTETVLLTLQTNQAQNNNQFRDSSINNFAVTRTGTPTQGTFTPFSQTGWSGYFNGSSYIATPASVSTSAGWNLMSPSTTGTFEAWVYRTSNDTGRVLASCMDFGASYTGWFIEMTTTGAVKVLGYTSGNSVPPTITSTGSAPLNTWTHVAVTCINGAITFYINGTVSGTGTMGATWQVNTSTSTPTWIGNAYTPWNVMFIGYLSNVRMVKGTAVYTGNFTPPTAPLTATQAVGTNIAAITGTATSLLTLQSNRFKDNSTNNFAITASGSPSIQSFSPLAPSAAYSATTVGGSMYFDGTGDYLFIPTAAPLVLAGGVWTIECWCYLTSSSFSTYRVVINKRSGSSAASYDLYFNITDGYLAFYNGTGYTSTVVPIINAWNHIAAVYDGTNINLYMNGVRVLQSATTNPDNGGNLYIAGDENGTSNYFIGYINDVRIVKGTALYSGTTYTVPSAPLTAIANTVLLLNATNAGIFDATGKNDLITVGDARVSTSVTKYGTGAMYFDGSGDNLRGQIGQIVFGTGNFTIEMWLYPQSAVGYQCILQIGTAVPYIFIGINTGSTGTPFMWNDTNVIVGSQNFAISAWQHWAIVRNNGTVTMYLNGTSIGSASFAGSLADGAGICIGTNIAGTQGFVGYIDDLRITKGIARYTTTFTPPTTAMLGQ